MEYFDDFTCRACLSNEPELTLYSLNDSKIRDLYTTCTSLEILDDELPKSICVFCLEKCESWAIFQVTCTNNEKRLVESFQRLEDVIVDDSVELEEPDSQMVMENTDEAIIELDTDIPLIEEEDHNDGSTESNFVEANAAPLIEIMVENVEETSINTQDDLIKCQFCGTFVMGVKQLESHFESHSKEKLYSCLDCNENFTGKGKFLRHMYEHSGIGISCPKCQFRCVSEFALQRHSKACEQYTCEVCGRSLKNLSSYRHHVQSHSSIKPFSCETCGQTFKYRQNLRDHLPRHTGIKTHQCKECPKSFYSNAELQDHIRRHHVRIKSHICPVCSKAFLKPSLLRYHARTHDEEKAKR